MCCGKAAQSRPEPLEFCNAIAGLAGSLITIDDAIAELTPQTYAAAVRSAGSAHPLSQMVLTKSLTTLSLSLYSAH